MTVNRQSYGPASPNFERQKKAGHILPLFFPFFFLDILDHGSQQELRDSGELKVHEIHDKML